MARVAELRDPFPIFARRQSARYKFEMATPYSINEASQLSLKSDVVDKRGHMFACQASRRVVDVSEELRRRIGRLVAAASRYR